MPDTASVQVVCPQCNAINRVPAGKLGDKPICGKCKQQLLIGAPLSADDGDFQRFADKSDLPLIVDFWASWCGPCQQFAPVFAEVAQAFSQTAVFLKLDTEASPVTASRFGIRSIPTLMLLYKGKEVSRLSGALPKDQFKQWVEQQLLQLAVS